MSKKTVRAWSGLIVEKLGWIGINVRFRGPASAKSRVWLICQTMTLHLIQSKVMKNNLWTTTIIFKPTEMRVSKIKMMYQELQKNYSWQLRGLWTRIPECAARRKVIIIPELKVPTPKLTLIISSTLVRITV